MTDNLRNDDSDIVVWHVGGEGGYGEAQTILEKLAPGGRLVVFEARTDSKDDTMLAERLSAGGIKTTIVFKGVGKIAGTSPFYVNKHPWSSSLLPPSPLAVNENPCYTHVHTWGEDTELDRLINVETVTLDDILALGTVPAPDIISMDAQGAELRILEGGQKALARALCVMTEVEYFEIYEEQHLFDDQMRFLTNKGFRLVEVLNPQYWHPGPAAGKGFLTVGEATFIRYAAKIPAMEGKRGYVPIETLSDAELLRLLGIVMASEMFGYTYTLAKELQVRNPEMYARLPNLPGYYKIVQPLVKAMDENWDSYKADPLWFLKMKIGIGRQP